MKILNLYAGVGGNRRLWGDKHQITAVELNSSVATCYADLYPNDTVIVGDAHSYLLDHYHEFDFIWASPPCQTHSSFRQNICVRFHGTKPEYPDCKLWQEIIFLKHNAKSNWVVENVRPYYKPLIQPDFILQRHFFWGNKKVIGATFSKDNIRKAQIPQLQQSHNIDLKKYKFEGIGKRQVLRNMVAPELGKYVFEQITGEKL